MDKKTEAENVFRLLDSDNKGYITVDKFIVAFRSFINSNKSDGLDDELEKVIAKMCPNSQGEIIFENFYDAFIDIKSKNDSISSKAQIQYSIKRFLSADSSTSESLDIVDASLDSARPGEEEYSYDPVIESARSETFSNRLGSRLNDCGFNNHLSAVNRARQLASAGASPRGSDHQSEVFTREIDSNFYIVKEQIKRLEENLNNLNDDQLDSDVYESGNLKIENHSLVKRINDLEDDIKDLEDRFKQRIETEKSEMRRAKTKIDDEKNREIELLEIRCLNFENESAEINLQITQCREESERLKLDKKELLDELNKADMKLSNLQEEYETLRRTSKENVDKLRKEKDSFEKMTAQLKTAKENSMDECLPKIDQLELHERHKELEELVINLRTENDRLTQQLGDITAELMEKNNKSSDSESLLSLNSDLYRELEFKTKEELSDILSLEKDANFKLRDYIEKIILKVMEKNQSLLEVCTL